MRIREYFDIKRICNNLPDDVISRLKEGVLLDFVDALNEFLDRERDLEHTIVLIHNFIITLFKRLEGPVPDDYIIPLMENW